MTQTRVRAVWWVILIVAVLFAGVVVAVLVAVRSPSQSAPSQSAPVPTGPATVDRSAPATVDCSAPTLSVTTADELSTALADAAAGDVIRMTDGTYLGNFTASGAGTEASPIALCGGADAILDGGDPDDGYVLHLDQASYWVLQGFTVQNGQKGVMADATSNSVIDGLTVHTIGDEAVHLRAFSSDNVITRTTILDTGLRKPKFGEGIYIGTAESNWCDISDCEPDESDRNQLIDNDISGTTAESFDIKEGTSDGLITGNTFDGSALADDADSWVDVKGSDWIIDGNVGTTSVLDGFQTHEIVDGWGTRNVFRNNIAVVNGPGFGYSLTPVRDNVVECNNKAAGAGEGLSNEPCSGG